MSEVPSQKKRSQNDISDGGATSQPSSETLATTRCPKQKPRTSVQVEIDNPAAEGEMKRGKSGDDGGRGGGGQVSFTRRIPNFLRGLVKTDAEERAEAATAVVSNLVDREDAEDEAPMVVEEPVSEDGDKKRKKEQEQETAVVAVAGKKAKTARRVVVTGQEGEEKGSAKPPGAKAKKKVALSFQDDL